MPRMPSPRSSRIGLIRDAWLGSLLEQLVDVLDRDEHRLAVHQRAAKADQQPLAAGVERQAFDVQAVAVLDVNDLCGLLQRRVTPPSAAA